MVARLLVVGGDAAGMSAASQARRLKPPEELDIVAFERGQFTSYAACGIPYFVGGVVGEVDDLVARTPAQFAERDIEVRLGHEVRALDTTGGRVLVANLEAGTEAWEPYDRLVIGTGAVPIRPRVPGIDLEGIFGVQTLGDGLAVDEALDGQNIRHGVVVGGGYVGLEMAEALVLRGLESVTLLDMAAQPMTTLDPDMGAFVREALESVGVDVRTGCAVDGFEARSDGRVGAVVAGKETFAADVVILGLGVRPNTSLAQDAGIEIGPSGGIRTDRRMRTSAPHVWAAGDCVESFHRISRKPVSIALGTHANKQGRVAGVNIGGGYATFDGVLGTAITKICDYEVARTGLSESDADAAGFAHLAITVRSSTRAGYFPGTEPMRCKLVVERRTGRLLGAQIVGKGGSAKRIDALAVALWNSMTVGEMAKLDLSYAPPFAPVWDPVLIAARKAEEAVVADAIAL